MNASYTITSNTRNFLNSSDKLRSKILTTALAPKIEREIKWFFSVERIKWALSFSDTPLSDFEIVKILDKSYPKKPNTTEKQVYALKKTFDYLHEEWTGNSLPLDLSTVRKIYDLSTRPYLGKMQGQTEISEKMILNSLKFINQGREHPIIQAGIMHIEFLSARLLENGNSLMARLLSYLILYKNGYDIRGLYSLDEFYKKDVLTYQDLIEKSLKEKGITTWLEYYAYGVTQMLNKSLEVVANEAPRFKSPKSLSNLNPRQKEVLGFLEKPENKVTNRQYQKMFNISQITASRDLIKLFNFGLTLSHGKGRSVYYTKA